MPTTATKTWAEPTGRRVAGALRRVGVDAGPAGNDTRGHIAAVVRREDQIDTAVDTLAAAFPHHDVTCSVHLPTSGINRSVTVLVHIDRDPDGFRRVQKPGPPPIPDGAFAREVTTAWRASGPVGSRTPATRHSAGAKAYATFLLTHTRDVAERHAALFDYDQLVDLERALAASEWSAALDAVESRRQQLQIDDPQAWQRHIGDTLPTA